MTHGGGNNMDNPAFGAFCFVVGVVIGWYLLDLWHWWKKNKEK
jgi:hypothetical protein